MRDDGLLEAALAAPFQSYDGQPVYPALAGQAARLGFGLVQNQPFVDGNKRAGAHVMLVFLALNGVDLVYTQQELGTVPRRCRRKGELRSPYPGGHGGSRIEQTREKPRPKMGGVFLYHF